MNHLANNVHHWAAMLSVAIGVFTAIALAMWAANRTDDPDQNS
ncbi:MAG TPA: hypothetical protein VGU69_15205 [Rhizomicrobium sp.]|nr:hypothetical protein [Rhizomicrobium sp.]